MSHSKGQSILEYIIVLTCIVAAIVVAVRAQYTTAITANYNKCGNYLKAETAKLPNSLN